MLVGQEEINIQKNERLLLEKALLSLSSCHHRK
jgi:hypothetical protein